MAPVVYLDVSDALMMKTHGLPVCRIRCRESVPNAADRAVVKKPWRDIERAGSMSSNGCYYFHCSDPGFLVNVELISVEWSGTLHKPTTVHTWSQCKSQRDGKGILTVSRTPYSEM